MSAVLGAWQCQPLATGQDRGAHLPLWGGGWGAEGVPGAQDPVGTQPAAALCLFPGWLLFLSRLFFRHSLGSWLQTSYGGAVRGDTPVLGWIHPGLICVMRFILSLVLTPEYHEGHLSREARTP